MMNTIRASVRPIVTIVMALAIVGGFFIGKVSADQFITIASAVVLFWFGSRSPKQQQDE